MEPLQGGVAGMYLGWHLTYTLDIHAQSQKHSRSMKVGRTLFEKASFAPHTVPSRQAAWMLEELQTSSRKDLEGHLVSADLCHPTASSASFAKVSLAAALKFRSSRTGLRRLAPLQLDSTPPLIRDIHHLEDSLLRLSSAMPSTPPPGRNRIYSRKWMMLAEACERRSCPPKTSTTSSRIQPASGGPVSSVCMF
jgi:hypothetical protein